WPSTALGCVVVLAAWVTAPWRRGIRMRLDLSTGTVETSGLPRLAGFRGVFNLGCFTFLVPAATTPISAVGTSSHETGHALTVARCPPGGAAHFVSGREGAVDDAPPRSRCPRVGLFHGINRSRPGPNHDDPLRAWPGRGCPHGRAGPGSTSPGTDPARGRDR